ncbi:MAG TPA: hypothetical protein PKA28_03590 [Methylomusa anaerophila]|uniref:hypothetical protein n=1 Tax=Methylomusa anaerophila TaxID=1930071 RepID=UPI0011AE78C5|nr:hypothetical protein [Methylomusa anaerophila]HML87510.1 hypothetical protein [Methylomusa anaerophila]
MISTSLFVKLLNMIAIYAALEKLNSPTVLQSIPGHPAGFSFIDGTDNLAALIGIVPVGKLHIGGNVVRSQSASVCRIDDINCIVRRHDGEACFYKKHLVKIFKRL